MDPSPEKQLHIERVEGNPEDIVERGQKIEALGQQMIDTAEILRRIKTEVMGDGGQKGKAIDALKETIGDAYKTLDKAGDLYQPVGPVITAYGEALAECKEIINTAASECQTKWNAYTAAGGDKDGPTDPAEIVDFSVLAGAGDGEPTFLQKQRAEANEKAALLYGQWETVAREWEGGYDTWENAFNDAVRDIKGELKDAIKDSFWSTLADFLEIAALVIGIAALIIGGPLMAALALAVGVALLAVTIMAKINGERSGTDIAFAVIGVVPFTKITSLTKLANVGAGSTKTVLKTATGIQALKGAGTQAAKLAKGQQVLHKAGLAAIFRNHGAAAGFRQLFTGSRTGFTQFHRGQKKLYEGLQYANARNLGSVRRLAKIDQVVTFFSTTGRNLNYVNLAAGQFGGSLPIPKHPVIKFAS